MGAEYLATWASDAVVAVTAGQSSATRIHSVGELIRRSGTQLVSAVLVGADKSDETLGMTHAPGHWRWLTRTDGRTGRLSRPGPSDFTGQH